MRHLTILLLLTAQLTSAQTVTLDISWRDTTTIGSDMSYAQAKARWPAWVGYMEHIGAQAKVLSIRKAVAAHNNAVWANDDGPGVTNYANGCGSRANIIWPAGVFRIDAELIKPQGAVVGEGSQGFLLDSWAIKSGGTTLVYDHAGWDGVGNHAGYGGDATKRYLLKDMTWGRTDNFGYTEGAIVRGFKIMGQGNDLHQPSYHMSAIGAWKAGEGYNIEDVFIYSCNNHGIELGGQFHATFYSERVSIFKSGIGAYGIYGGGHLQVHMGSFDDNPACFHVRPDAAGSIGNGTTIKVYGIKFETGKTAARPYSRGQELLDSEGMWTKLDVYGFAYSRVNSVPHALIRYKGQAGLRSVVNIYGVTWFDKPSYMLHDRDKGLLYEMDQSGFSSAVTTWCWNSVDGPVLSPGVTLRPVAATCDERLAPLARDPMTGQPIGSWQGCTPLYSYTQPIASEGGTAPPPQPIPPPPPPAQLSLVWATTFAGSSRCTLQATTGSPIAQATTYACASAMGGTIRTGTCTSYQAAIPARRIVLLGVTFTSWSDYGWLCSAVRTRSNGDLQDLSGNVLGKVTAGVKVDRLTLELPPGTTLQSVLGPAAVATCGSPVLTMEGMEIYN